MVGEEQKVAVLNPWQVWDSGRGCFFVKIEPTRDKYLGLPVYEDAFGKRFVIKGTV